MVELEHVILIFDYYDGEVPSIPTNKPIYFFASHGHFDHCSELMFEIGKNNRRTFIFAKDIRITPPESDVKITVEENQKYQVDDMNITTFHSNDLGVAFLIEVEGKVIYHAGDLNWWHWEGEDPNINRRMEVEYKDTIQLLKSHHKKIDVAFLPMDQRLELAYDYGIKYFMQEINVENVIPMHFFSENFDICQKVLDENNGFAEYNVNYIKVKQLQQVFMI